MKQPSARLDYLDWLRGLAVVVMVQSHSFDSLLHTQFRNSEWFWLSQFLGGLPAAIFLFLVGISLAIVLDRLRQKGCSGPDLMWRVVKRSAYIFTLAYAFRLQQFLVWFPAARWQDLFRVDTLNCIAASSLLIGAISIPLKSRKRNIFVFTTLTVVFVAITPWVYPMRQVAPGFLLDYINGSGHSNYFSIFPWSSFALLGMAFGYTLLEARARGAEARLFDWVIAIGALLYGIGLAMPYFKIFEYGFFDYSRTSPHFFFVRLGWISVILYCAFRWSLRKTRHRWSPLRTFGQASLLIYWVHIELVYGKSLNEYSRSLDLIGVMRQLAWILPAMLLLAWAKQYGFVRLFKQIRSWVTVRRQRPIEM